MGVSWLPLAVVLLLTSEPEEARVASTRAVYGAVSAPGHATRRDAIADLRRRVEYSAAAGARIIALPSWFDRLDDRAVLAGARETIPGPSTQALGRLARTLGVFIAAPIVERLSDETHALTLVLVDPDGRIAARQRKRNASADRTEGSGFVREDVRRLHDSIDVGGYRIGMAFDDDLETSVPWLVSRGAEVILVSATLHDGRQAERDRRAQRLASKHGVSLVIANRMPHPPRVHGSRHALGEAKDRWAITATIPRRARALHVPLGLPAPIYPLDRPFTEEIVSLGRDLFFDRDLSANGEVSCASCHDPSHAFSTPRPRGIGIHGRATKRNVPTVLNAAFRRSLQWDGGSASLELQAKFPMTHASEMDLHYLHAPERLAEIPYYVERFGRAFGKSSLEFDDIAAALAAYQRSLLSGGSAFDRWYFGKEEEAITKLAADGFELFVGRAGCSQCHTMNERDALFSDHDFHNTGVGYSDGSGFSDLGLGALSDATRAGFFQTPSLRDVARTPPYMHDGSLATLSDVVRFYAGGGIQNPLLDDQIRPFEASERDVRALVAFLETLTGEERYSPLGLPLEPIESGHRASKSQSFEVSALCTSPSVGEVGPNADRIEAQVRAAASAGSEFIVIAEHAFAGRPRALLEAGIPSLPAPALEPRLTDLAVELGVWIAAPISVPNRDEVSMIALIDDRGRIRARQSKVNVLSATRDAYLAPGDIRLARAVESPLGRLGIIAGDDVVQGFMRLAELGVETALVSASWEETDGVDWIGVVRELARRYRMNAVVATISSPAAPCASLVVKRDGSIEARPDPTSGIALGRLFKSPRQHVIDVPLGLPEMVYPTGRAFDPRCAELGRRLFFDSSISSDGQTSCATCHDPQKHFTDRLALAAGVYSRKGQRNTPTIINSAFRRFFFWDGRAPSLEMQLVHAVHGWSEMDVDRRQVEEVVNASAEYRLAFTQIIGPREIRFDDVSSCISDFERTIVSASSPFDRYYFEADRGAISESAARGLQIFVSRGRCIGCHSIDEGSALFTDGGFHNTGVGFHGRFQYLGYGGDGLPTPFSSRDQFRGEYLTPSLRNVAETAPYMHDGSIETLEEVVEFYDRGGIANPFLDPRIERLHLSERDRKDLVAFLHTLTGDRSFESPRGGGK